MQKKHWGVARSFDKHWIENSTTGCWEWQLSLDVHGYGERIRVDGKRIFPHRYAYERVNGPIATGLLICHHCDNRRCVNPAHLFAGTARENTHDAVSKQRMAQGERQGLSKLNETDVERIRDIHRAGHTQPEIAEYFGISQATVSQIVLRKTWRHV